MQTNSEMMPPAEAEERGKERSEASDLVYKQGRGNEWYVVERIEYAFQSSRGFHLIYLEETEYE